jgi:hypothetical protein
VSNGTADAPIGLTTIRDDSIGGDLNGDGDASVPGDRLWDGIYGEGISGNARAFTLDYTTVSYGGSVQANNGLTPLIRNSTFLHGTRLSVWTSQSIAVTDNVIDQPGNVQAGLVVTQLDTTGSATTLVSRNTVNGASGSHSRIWANGQPGGGVGILVDATRSADAAPPTVQNNTVTASTEEAIIVLASTLLPDKVSGNTGSNNGINAIGLAGTLLADLTLPVASGLPVIVANSEAAPGIKVASGVTLTLQPGYVLKFSDFNSCGNCSDAGRPSLAVYGTLSASRGTGGPIGFTTITDDILGGDTNNDGNATTPYVTSWDGIFVGQGGTARLDGVHISYATIGINSYTDSVVVRGEIAGNRNGVRTCGQAACTVDARDVYWGSADGPAPYGSGDSVDDYVAVSPWLTEPPA